MMWFFSYHESLFVSHDSKCWNQRFHHFKSFVLIAPPFSLCHIVFQIKLCDSLTVVFDIMQKEQPEFWNPLILMIQVNSYTCVWISRCVEYRVSRWMISDVFITVDLWRLNVSMETNQVVSHKSNFHRKYLSLYFSAPYWFMLWLCWCTFAKTVDFCSFLEPGADFFLFLRG